MLNLSFYNLSAVLMILVLLKFSLSQSGVNRLLKIFLGSTLTFSVFDTWFSFLPLLFYFFTHQTESFSLLISTIFDRLKRFTTGQTGKQSTPEEEFLMDKGSEGDSSNPTPPQGNIFSFLFSKKPKEAEGQEDKGSVERAGKGPKDLLDSPSGPFFSGQWSFSPAEQSLHYCIEKTKYWANLGGCTAALVGISEIVLGICRRLNYTQVLVKKLTH